MEREKVVIIGGGFGGLNAAKKLGHSKYDVLLIDKKNHHLFQPLLYQVASAVLSPGDIATPLREILDKYENIEIIMGEVASIDKSEKKVTLTEGEIYNFDYLVLAIGSHHSYFGHNQWAHFAPGLKDINDAINIRENILLAFEWAERCDDPEEIKKALRFVIVGGGPTGVELAGALSEIARKALFRNFRKIKPEHSEIYLIEGSDRLLRAYPPDLSEKAKLDLEKMGVKVLTDTEVSNVTSEGVQIGDTFISAYNILWAAGNQIPPLLKTLNTPLDRSGRAKVNPDLSIPDYENIFVIGDAANCAGSNGTPLPGIAPVAIQQGRFIAKYLKKKKKKPFRYFDKGSLATIGKEKAVGMVGNTKLTGFIAWAAWSLIHIFYLISFTNRLVVMTKWFFSYLTGSHYVRLIKKPLSQLKK